MPRLGNWAPAMSDRFPWGAPPKVLDVASARARTKPLKHAAISHRADVGARDRVSPLALVPASALRGEGLVRFNRLIEASLAQITGSRT